MIICEGPSPSKKAYGKEGVEGSLALLPPFPFLMSLRYTPSEVFYLASKMA